MLDVFSPLGVCRRRGYTLVVTVLLLLIAFWLRVYLLQDTILDPDEYRRIGGVVQEAWREVFASNRWAYVLVKVSTEILGETIFTLRWPSVVLGMLSLALTWRIARRLLGSTVAAVSMLLMMFSPLHIQNSRRMASYSAFVFLGLLSLYFFDGALRTRRWYHFLGFGIATILGFYTFPFAAFWLAAQGVVVLMLVWQKLKRNGAPVGRRRVALGLALVGVAGVVVLAGLGRVLRNPLDQVLLVFNTALPTSPRPFSDTYDIFRQMGQGEWGFSAPYNWVTIVMAIWVVLGLVIPSRDPWPKMLLGTWLFIPVALAMAAYWLTPAFGVYFRPRFLAFLMPPYYILAASGIIALSDWIGAVRTSRNTSLRVRAALALGTVALSMLPVAWYFSAYTNGNWQAVSSYLRDQLRPNDIVLCALNAYWDEDEPKASTCPYNLQYNLQGHTVYSVEYIDEIATYKEVGEHPIQARRPYRVWVVLWNIQETSSPIQKAAVRTFTDLGRSGILLAEGGTVVSNLIDLLRTLEDLTPEEGLRLRYRLRRAELLIATGQASAAHETLTSAEELAISKADYDEIGRVQGLLGYPPLVSSPEVNLGATFDHQIQLVGFSPEQLTLAPGHPMRLTLFWKALQQSRENYTVFLHLRDAAGGTVWQSDFQPFDGVHPTSSWAPGDIIEETRWFSLPDEFPPGNYYIYLGLYKAETLERLPLQDDRSGESAVVIGPVSVLSQSTAD